MRSDRAAEARKDFPGVPGAGAQCSAKGEDHLSGCVESEQHAGAEVFTPARKVKTPSVRGGWGGAAHREGGVCLIIFRPHGQVRHV